MRFLPRASLRACGCTAVVASCAACSGRGPDFGGDPRLARLTLGLDASAPSPIVASIEDLGQFSAPASVIGRDGTTSANIDGNVLWTFGDTFVTHPNPIDGSGLLSSTSGWSTVAAPLQLAQDLDDAGDPFQFIPYTPDEIAANRADEQTGIALWPGPVLATGDGGAVVVFQHVLRRLADGGGFAVDAIGTAGVMAGAAQATRNVGFLFQGSDPLFGGGGATVDGGFVYLYDCEQVRTLDYECKVARAPVMLAASRSSYTFWDGSAWTADITQATWFIDGASYAMSVEWNAWLDAWLAVYSVPLSNDIALRTAPAITGPWGPQLTVPGNTPGLVTSGAGLNYLAKQHVELSSPDGRSIVVGYAHPL